MCVLLLLVECSVCLPGPFGLQCFLSSVSSLMFYLDVLPIVESGVLKSITNLLINSYIRCSETGCIYIVIVNFMCQLD